MKKKLILNNLELHVNVNEHLNDYISIFENYFHIIGHHCGSGHIYNKNALLIYSSFSNNIRCSGCSQTPETINILKTSGSRTGDCFFENAFGHMPCERLLDISYDGHLIGKYCKKNNILAISDIAHDGGNFSHITTIFEELVSKNILKIKSKTRSKSKNIKITLGADPEFETKIKGKDVSAYDLISINTREKAFISHDGRTQPQREFRPDPAETPGELVENIRDLIRISSFFGEELYVTGNRMPLGGHIHIGNATPCSDLITAMDYFFFPLTIFNSKLRKESPYGKAGDVRCKSHGFEYRTLPSVWLTTPILATMTLELMKTIVENMINGKEIIITDKFEDKSYTEDLISLGFSDEWCKKFAEELSNLYSNMKLPLDKLWDCEIPERYKVYKLYTSKSSCDTLRAVRVTSEEET